MHSGAPDWNDIHLILTVARCGSFYRAASELGIDQATVSRRIAQLEAEAKVPLFSRRSTGATVTEAGRRLADCAEETAKMVENFGRVFRSLKDQSTPILVSAPEGIATYLLGPSLAAVSADLAPETPLKLPSDLKAIPPLTFVPVGSEADIDIMLVKPGSPLPFSQDVHVRKIGLMKFSPVASAKYLAKHGLPNAFKALRKHRLLSNPVYDSHPAFIPWRDLLDSSASGPPFVAATSSALHRSVIAGAGVTLLPNFSNLIDPAVTLISCKTVPIDVEVWLGAHPDNLRLKSARLVYDTIADMFTHSAWFDAR